MKYGKDGFVVNSPQVVHDTFEGEAVIINLESGNYYSLRKTGEFIWNCLAGGQTPEEVVKFLEERYSTQAGIGQIVDGFVGELLEEELIRPSGNEARSSANETGVMMSLNGSFEPPVIDRYTDMQELLLLDPIHEVDEQGWPMASRD